MYFNLYLHTNFVVSLISHIGHLTINVLQYVTIVHSQYFQKYHFFSAVFISDNSLENIWERQFKVNKGFFCFTGLNLEQVDTLWSCLAEDSECSDDCLSWFLNQAKSKDHHALGLETFKHIFLEKVRDFFVYFFIHQSNFSISSILKNVILSLIHSLIQITFYVLSIELL